MAQNKSNEERETSIIIQPLGHRCVVIRTDEHDSTSLGFYENLDPKDYFITLCSDTKFEIIQGYTIEVTRRMQPLGGLIQALRHHSSHIYEN